MPATQKIARSFLLKGAAAAILMLAYALWNRWEGLVGASEWKETFLYYIAPLTSLAVALIVAAMHRSSDPLLVLVIVGSFIVGLFLTEIFLQFRDYDVRGRSMAAAGRLSQHFDKRSMAEVVADLRKDGIDASPFVRVTSNPKILPLGLVSATQVVTCNEFGPWFIVHTDRHGFNNPDRVWESSSPLDLMILGDSFALGQCDPITGGFAALLRASGLRVLNLGVGGNDPLLNLASLVEYGALRSTRIIYWVHYAGNDLSGLELSKTVAILQSYLNDATFSQDLVVRSEEVDRLLRAAEQNAHRADDKRGFISYFMTWKTLSRTLRLYAVRSALGMARNIETNADFNLFSRVLARARDVALQVGAKLVVVNIPAAGQLARPDSALERKTATNVIALGIDYIDLKPVFQKEADPFSVFAHAAGGGHLTPIGNQIVARVLEEHYRLTRIP